MNQVLFDFDIKNLKLVVSQKRVVIETYLLKLNRLLHADFLFVAETNQCYSEATSLITISEQTIIDNFSYSLADTPCATLFETDMCVYPSGVAEAFPKDFLLDEMGIVAYLGLPIVTAEGRPVGILVALFKRELESVELIQHSFEMFAGHLSTLLQETFINEKMQRQNQVLEEVSRSARIGSWQLDIDEMTMHWSDQLCELFEVGHQFRSIHIDSMLDLVNPQDKSKARLFFESARLNQKNKSISFQLLNSSGQYRTVVCSVIENLEQHKISGLLQDISEKKYVYDQLATQQKELLAQEKMMQDIMNCSPAVIYVKDVDGKYLYINDQYLRIFGLVRGDIIGKSDLDIFPEATAQELMLNDRNVIASKSHIVLEEQIPQPDGVKLYISEKFPLVDSNGDVYALCGISTDVTDRRNQEMHLRQAQKMEAIGQLAGGIAHDFNNHLASIMGYAELALAGDNPQKNKKYIKNILLSAENSSELTKKLLTFSRKENVQKEVLNLHQLIRDTSELLSHTLEKRIEIKTDLSASNAFIEGNKSVFQNVLINLGLNARDAMPSGGVINIRTANVNRASVPYIDVNASDDPNSFVRLDFEDTGIGIEEATLAKVFDPFFTTKEQGKGTGMGLASAYGTIKDMGGTIEVESFVDIGTTFKLYIPTTLSVPICDRGAHAAETGNQVTMRTILLVDDEPSIRDLCQEFFDSLGYHSMFACDGSQAVELYTKHWAEIDLVILDMLMPKMTGEETFHKLKSINPDVKVVIASGYTANISTKDLMLAGVFSFLDKPYKLSDLQHCIEQACNS